MNIENKLTQMGLTLPQMNAPIGSYVPYTKVGNLLYISGQTARSDDGLPKGGKVGAQITLDQAYHSAQITALKILAIVKHALGDLDKVKQIIKLHGYVAGAPGFTQHPTVINGASDLFVQLYGDKGKHARLAIGASDLPNGAIVEIDAIIEIQE